MRVKTWPATPAKSVRPASVFRPKQKEKGYRCAKATERRVGFWAKKASVVLRRCARRSSGVIAAKRLPVARRQRRDSATASKVFFFVVAMDQEGWSHDAHRRVTLQHIHGI